MRNATRRDVVTLEAAFAEGVEEWLDVRSPGEYALDHVPGAVNCPVLDNAERAQVGTLYKQVSPFEARRLGGALVTANISRHMATLFAQKPKTWRPVVYCWRGGERSGAMTTWLRLVGWDARQLVGGYKTWRRAVAHDLAEWPAQFRWRVVGGATGCGKTRLLHALREAGVQVLDLEGLARHRGSVLGAWPHALQPSQKMFETGIHSVLAGFDRAKPVYVEAESRKIGTLFIPEALMQTLRTAPCVELHAPLPARLELLLEDYGWFGTDRAALVDKLACLSKVQSRERISRWQDWARAGALPQLFEELLTAHYDPLYARSLGRQFTGMATAQHVYADTLDAAAMRTLAAQVQAGEERERQR